MQKILAVIAAMALTGCAAQVVTSTPKAVTVKGLDVKDVHKLAQAECQRQGRDARLNYRDPDTPTWYFDCL